MKVLYALVRHVIGNIRIKIIPDLIWQVFILYCQSTHHEFKEHLFTDGLSLHTPGQDEHPIVIAIGMVQNSFAPGDKSSVRFLPSQESTVVPGGT